MTLINLRDLHYIRVCQDHHKDFSKRRVSANCEHPRRCHNGNCLLLPVSSYAYDAIVMSRRQCFPWKQCVPRRQWVPWRQCFKRSLPLKSGPTSTTRIEKGQNETSRQTYRWTELSRESQISRQTDRLDWLVDKRERVDRGKGDAWRQSDGHTQADTQRQARKQRERKRQLVIYGWRKEKYAGGNTSAANANHETL